MRILRAFAWLRWRVLMNSLERSGARDTLERFSLAIEQLGPIMAALLMVPSAIVLAGAGAYGGWALAQGNAAPVPFETLRFLFLLACVLATVGPLLLPAGERTNTVRLLLLPISRRLLYVAQAATGLTDPWVLLVVPAVVAVSLGLLAGGAWTTWWLAAGAGVLLVLVLLGISSLASSVIHVVVRNRRRGELMMLILILVIPLVGILPMLSTQHGTPSAREDRRAARAEWHRTFGRVLPLAPSEMYVKSTRAAAQREIPDALRPLVGLTAMVALLHAAAYVAFSRMLDSPGSAGTRRSEARGKVRTWKIPGVSPGTSAVAVNQMRLALRTPRGRSIVLSPLVVFVMFGAMMWRGRSGVEFGFIFLENGLSLAIFGSFTSLLAVLPFAMNQFAIDRAGLTLAFLSPLDDGELLRGKAIGNAVVAGVPALICIAGAAALFPGGSWSSWLSVTLGTAASYVLASPAAAALSALFPRPVDLNSIGNGSNAHGAANLLGFATFLATGGLTLVLALTAWRTFGPLLSVVLMVVWFGLCAMIARLLFLPARALLSRRRENLALIRERA